MGRLVTSLVILVFVTNLSFAHGMMQQSGGQMGMMGEGITAHTMGGMHPMMYSMMVRHVLVKANNLDLTDTQKKEVANIQEQYVYPMVRKEADFKISHMKIINMLQNPNFDPTKVKKEIKVSNEINLEMANMSIDALAAIRKTIGVENFKKATEMMSMMGGEMMKSETTVEKEEHKH